MPYSLEQRSSGYYRVGVNAAGMTIVTGMAPLNPAYSVEEWLCRDCQILMRNVTFAHCPNCDSVNLGRWNLTAGNGEELYRAGQDLTTEGR